MGAAHPRAAESVRRRRGDNARRRRREAAQPQNEDDIETDEEVVLPARDRGARRAPATPPATPPASPPPSPPERGRRREPGDAEVAVPPRPQPEQLARKRTRANRRENDPREEYVMDREDAVIANSRAEVIAARSRNSRERDEAAAARTSTSSKTRTETRIAARSRDARERDEAAAARTSPSTIARTIARTRTHTLVVPRSLDVRERDEAAAARTSTSIIAKTRTETRIAARSRDAPEREEATAVSTNTNTSSRIRGKRPRLDSSGSSCTADHHEIEFDRERDDDAAVSNNTSTSSRIRGKRPRLDNSGSSSTADHRGIELDREQRRNRRERRKEQIFLEAEEAEKRHQARAKKKDAAVSKVDLCTICMEAIKVRGILDCCEHKFCYGCIKKWFVRSCRCPLCRRVAKGLTSTTTGLSERVRFRELTFSYLFYSDPESDDPGDSSDSGDSDDSQSTNDVQEGRALTLMEFVEQAAPSLLPRASTVHRAEIPSNSRLPEISARFREIAPASSSSTPGASPSRASLDQRDADEHAMRSRFDDAIHTYLARRNQGATTSNNAPRMPGSGTEDDPIVLDD